LFSNPAGPCIGRNTHKAFETAQRQRLVQLCAAARLEEPELLADELFLMLEGARDGAEHGHERTW
jgi:hypothetical protein